MEYYKNKLSLLNKSQAVAKGIEISKAFLKLNNIELPEYRTDEISWAENCGYYDFTWKTIVVHTPLVAHVIKAPAGMRWSYPGYRIDRTGIGVVCHETGHHVDNALHNPSRRMPIDRAERITNYEPNHWEVFAESIRLFILNPDLLKVVAPKRYKYLMSLGLKPIVKATWNEVLAHQPRLIDMVIKQYDVEL